MPFAVVGHGSRVHYAERGERRAGEASVLLVHGAGASSAIWMMTMARLARAAHVVAIDLPGHGPSPRPDGNDGVGALSLAAYRDAVGALAATLCLGPSVLVGHSMGALVAIEAALTWPDKVRGLVLCAGAARLPVRDELLALIRDDHTRFPAWMAEHALSPRARPAVRRAFADRSDRADRRCRGARGREARRRSDARGRGAPRADRGARGGGGGRGGRQRARPRDIARSSRT